MKKIFLSAAALFAAVSIQAQDVKVTWLSGNSDGETVPELTSTSTHATIVGEDVALGSGIDASKNAVAKVTSKEAQTAADGTETTNQNLVGGNFLSITNICENSETADPAAPKTYEDAQSLDTKLTFHVTAPSPDVFYFHNLTMDVCGVGTDAVRMQVVLRSEGDENKEVVVLTEENCHEFAEDGGWMKAGWRPSRNDGTKPDKTETVTDEATGETTATYTSIQSPNGYTHLVIPASKVADVAGLSYDFYVDVYYWGVANNKSMGIRNVVVEGSSTDPADTGINSVSVDKAVDAPAYNIAGQRVSKDTKGLVIVGGKKYLNK